MAQQDLFPHVATAIGPLSSDLELLVCGALATAFLAKAILNLPTTRDLRERLRVDTALRRLCG